MRHLTTLEWGQTTHIAGVYGLTTLEWSGSTFRFQRNVVNTHRVG